MDSVPSHVAESDDLDDLPRKVARRDRVAFAQIYQRTSAKLFGIIVRICGDRQRASDVLQEVCFKVWNKADLYNREAGRPMIWPAAIARTDLMDRTRWSGTGGRLDGRLLENNAAQQAAPPIHPVRASLVIVGSLDKL